MLKFSPVIQPLPDLFPGKPVVSVLGLHTIHPIISGNKWFKLAPYIQSAKNAGCHKIITAGGAYSNHIIATARAARDAGMLSSAFIRGEEPQMLSPTLLDAKRDGMELVFMDRRSFADLNLPPGPIPGTGHYFIPAGGKGKLGVIGSGSIIASTHCNSFSHIAGACGTGTMIAGLQYAATSFQKIIGISVLKNLPEPLPSIRQELEGLNCNRLPDIFHFAYGGYAQPHPVVLAFMQEAWEKERLPLDFVYTGKLFCAIRQLREEEFFPREATILLIHSGGLQGNRSLPEGSLPF
jgi:1-aminocyclopropane-1-carboxylate deaminase